LSIFDEEQSEMIVNCE